VKRSPSVVAEEDGDALLPSLCAANFLITFESKEATATGGKQIKPTVSLGTFGFESTASFEPKTNDNSQMVPNYLLMIAILGLLSCTSFILTTTQRIRTRFKFQIRK
jgi:hypothetical protein